MKVKSKVIFVVVSVICLLFIALVIIRNINIKALKQMDIQSLYLENSRKECAKIRAYRNIELGNIIAYPNDEKYSTYLIGQIAYGKYGVFVCHSASSIDLSVVKPIMDSVINSRYGSNFYKDLLDESNRIQKISPEKITMDQYSIDVDYNYSDNIKTKEYVIDELKKRKQLPIKQPKCFPRNLIIDFIVKKNGQLVKPRILLKCNPVVDSIVINLLKNLPFRWSPGRRNESIVEFRKEISWEFGLDPLYRKID